MTDKFGGSEGDNAVDPVKLRLSFLKSLGDLQSARIKLVSEASRLEVTDLPVIWSGYLFQII